MNGIGLLSLALIGVVLVGVVAVWLMRVLAAREERSDELDDGDDLG